MRFVHAALLVAVTPSAALAQQGPVIVVPGRPDVPIFENGVNVTWSVVEGEFGLDRPGQVTPTVIYRLPPPVISTYLGAAAYEPGYFPRDGRTPGYGRLEINPPPNRRLPPPAQPYRRSWSSEFGADAGRPSKPQPDPDGHLAVHLAEHRPGFLGRSRPRRWTWRWAGHRAGRRSQIATSCRTCAPSFLSVS